MADLPTYQDSLVQITGRKNSALGTGFVIWHEGAATYLLTCKHVVDATAAGDDRRTVLIDGKHEATPLYESVTGDPDLSVLVSQAPELLGKLPLKLGRVTRVREAWVAGYFQFSDEEERMARSVRFRILGHWEDPELIIQQDAAFKVIRGNSGSPVLDDEFRCVIGVVNATPVQRRRDTDPGDSVIKATPIQLLEKIWPGLPADLFFEFEDSGQMQIEPDWLQKLEHLGDIGLRILLAASTSTDAGGVNSETATIKETLDRVFNHSALRKHFALEIYECLDGTRIRRVPANSSDTEVIPSVPLGEFDLILIVAWHNLGSGGLDLEKLDREAWRLRAQRQSGRPERLFYHCQDDAQAGLKDARRPEWIRQSERAEAYVRHLYEQDVPVTRYRKEEFNRVFLADLRRFIGDVVAFEFQQRGATDRSADVASAAEDDNPYVGLRAYKEEDSAKFFGRSNEVEQLCEHLVDGGHRLLAVVGASGSGKSSLVRAGLLSRLKWDAIPGSSRWVVVDFSLATHARSPLAGLAAELHGLLRKSPRNPYRSGEHLERDLRDPTRLDLVAQAVLAACDGEGRLLLFIDQFEELFTLVGNETQRDHVVRFMAAAVESRRINILLTLRADYYDRLLQLAPLAGALRSGVYSVPVLQPKALLAIITGPARFGGLSFEDPTLPFEILQEAGSEGGMLPLLSYALHQLAAPPQRSANRITRAAYERLGGVQGLVQKKADEVIREVQRQINDGELESFDVSEALKILFRRLVSVDENGKAAKRPAPFRPQDSIWPPGVRCLATQLVNQRLLQTGGVSQKDQSADFVPTIELAHEALLTHWRELQEWIRDQHEGLLVLHRVEVCAREWHLARSRARDEMAALAVDRQLFWSDSRLQEVERTLQVLGMPRAELDSVVRDFIRPEGERLREELVLPIDHARRAWIGDRLAELGDTRAGVGLGPHKLPDIVWCRVPPGTVRIEGVPQSVGAFHLARYPVTLTQFNVFAESEAYHQEEWWRELSVRPREHPPVLQRPEVSNHPAQFISWYQAVAYCRWLSARLGYPMRLPTEWEWQQAATGGREGQVYPWGREWNPDLANTKGGAGRLVSVGLYPAGASPVGALDMSGNMYEWCQNEYEDLTCMDVKGTNPRTTRGGAYFTLNGQEAREAVMVTARVCDNADGCRGKTRIRACIRLACDNPSEESRVQRDPEHQGGE